MTFRSSSRATVLAIAMIGSAGSALAAGGNVASASLTPGAVFPADSLSLKVGVTQGSFGTDCKIRWSLKDAANVEVKGGTHRLVSDTSSADYSVGFAAPALPGQYKLEVMGGPPDSQTTSCGGSAFAALTVKDKLAISATPPVMNVGVSPRPAPTPVVQMPATIPLMSPVAPASRSR